MAGLTIRNVLGRLGIMEAPPERTTPDQELLGRFLAARDAQAFAALMERHGSMVHGVCRRILRNTHDAEDACQAVFLVLARRAASIRRKGSLASWLHGVAWRVANKLRNAHARRHAHEASAASQNSTTSEPGDISWREVQQILDEELSSLPKVYQAPLVLCYLEGRTQDEAAQELGWSLGALRGRLERGREMLRLRLTRRGVTGAAALAIGALLPSLSSAAVPQALVAATAEASVPISVGAPIPASVSAQVAALTREALQTPLLTKLSLAAVVVLSAVAVSVAVAFFFTQGAQTVESARAQPEEVEVWSETHRLDVPNGHVWSVAFSPDGKRIAAGSRRPLPDFGELRMWDADTRQLQFALETQRGVRCVAFAPDGKILATAEHDGMARLRDAADGRVLFTLRGHRSQIDSAAFSDDGKTVATSGWDQSVKLWDTADGLEIRTLEGHHGQVFCVAGGGPDDALASGGVDQTAKIWQRSTGRTLFTLRGHTDTVHWLAFAPPDGKILATASWDKSVRLWDATNGKRIATLEGHTDSVLALAFSRDGKTLATSAGQRMIKDMPGEVILWDLSAQKARARLQTKDRVYGLAFSPDGTTLAAACWDGAVTLWKQEAGRQPPGEAEKNLKFVLATAQERDDAAPTKDYKEDFHPALDDKQKEIPGLMVYGPDAPTCVKFAADGMHITLPSGYPKVRPGTGVITDFGVKGDFEITVSFEVLPDRNARLPADLRVVIVPDERAKPEVWHKAGKNRAVLAREIADRNYAGQFLASLTKWNEDIPRDKWNNEDFSKVEQQSNQRSPTAAKRGQLRLVRSGAMLYFLTSEGESKDFTLLHKTEYGLKDLKNVRILASTSGPEATLDIRITDVRIRADALPKTAAAILAPEAEANGYRWWLISLALAVPFAMIAIALGVLLLMRMRRRPATANPTADAPVSAMIAFACQSCGKRLKVKKERARDKVKCPHCGKTVAMPKGDSEDLL